MNQSITAFPLYSITNSIFVTTSPKSRYFFKSAVSRRRFSPLIELISASLTHDFRSLLLQYVCSHRNFRVFKYGWKFGMFLNQVLRHVGTALYKTEKFLTPNSLDNIFHSASLMLWEGTMFLLFPSHPLSRRCYSRDFATRLPAPSFFANSLHACPW